MVGQNRQKQTTIKQQKQWQVGEKDISFVINVADIMDNINFDKT